MGYSADIKIKEQKFEETVDKLKGYKMILTDSRNKLISKNNELSDKWSGNSKTAFLLSSNVIEADFINLIDKINEEIQLIDEVKMEMIKVDTETQNLIGAEKYGL